MLFLGLAEKRLHDYNCGFKMYAAQAAQGIVVYGQQHRFIPLLAHFAGYKVRENPRCSTRSVNTGTPDIRHCGIRGFLIFCRYFLSIGFALVRFISLVL